MASDEARELNLVGKVEMRIALADCDAKLQTLLATYLVPLLLKLASDHVSVRNKVISVCQHINKRLASASDLALPVPALLKQYHESENAFVRQFDLTYITQGLDRLSFQEKKDILPDLLHGAQDKLWNVGFFMLLRLLPSWKLPERGSNEDAELRGQFKFSGAESNHLSHMLGRFLLYGGNGKAVSNSTSSHDSAAQTIQASIRVPRSPGLTAEEIVYYSRLDELADSGVGAAGSGSFLSRIKYATANFLFTATFSDPQRFIPAVILSADSSNLTAYQIGDTMFKQCTFNLEAEENIQNLYDLYFSRGAKDAVSPRLRMRILALLCKSKTATDRAHRDAILEIIDQQLFSEDGQEIAGLEASKLRAAIFSFLNWTVRVGEDISLSTIAPRAQEKLREYIESQGWPDSTGPKLSQPEADLRARAYESIGILATKSRPNIDLVKWLFNSLRCDLSDGQIHVSIDEALGRVLNVYGRDVPEQSALKAMLLWHMNAEIGDEDPEYAFTTRRSTRFAVVRYANRCFGFDDVDARWIDILATGDSRHEIVEEGMKGLNPSTFDDKTSKGTSGVILPEFKTLVGAVLGSVYGTEMTDDPQGKYLLALPSAVTFCRNILHTHVLRSSHISIAVNETDWDRAIDILLTTNENARRAVRAFARNSHEDDKKPTNAVDKGHCSVAACLGALIQAALHGMSLDLRRCGEHATELCGLISNEVLSGLPPHALATCKRALASNNLATQMHAARTFGILVSHPACADYERQSALVAAVRCAANWSAAMGPQVGQVRASLLSSAFLITRLSLRQIPTELGQHIRTYSAIISDIVHNSRDLTLKEPANTAIGQICLCLAETEISHLEWDWTKVIDCLVKDARKEQEIAITALGRLIFGLSKRKEQASIPSDSAKYALEQLYSLHEARKAEVHFAVGEALAVAVNGWRSSTTTAEFDVDAELPRQPSDDILLAQVLDKVIADCRSTKPYLKKSSAIWLLCIIQYTGNQSAVRSRLQQCQATFARLLSDRDEVVQETGSRGLSLVYEIGDKSVREDLVRDLVQSFTGTNARVGGTVSEETELFESGALPTGEGSVTTYKDIVSLAAEMGDPSLVYRFMNLSSNNAIWTSRAAFGRFGLRSILADSTYLTENKKFYPKLYRYRFDPNPNVQRSMNDIWKALVKDPDAVLDQNFDLIMDDLLKSILGKEWRVREATCAAIADLVQARDIEKYVGYLDRIWSVAFKVLDDIKETVRFAAMTLCRTLTNLLIRNLEVGEGTTVRAKKLLEQAVPFLLRQLESGAAKEVQQYAIITVLQVVKKAPPKALRPFAPVMLETLVESLSSLEHEGVNYIHLNAHNYGVTAEKLDKMRVSSLSTSPVMEAIERCLESVDSSPSQDGGVYTNDAMNRLANLFKTAIGLPSKVGLSRVLVTLATRHNVMFRPYADRFVRLLRKHVLDRNETVSVAYSMSLAYVIRLCTDAQIEETITFAKGLYFDTEEVSHRTVAAEVVHAIAKVANDAFMHFAPAFLPFAFVGKKDEVAGEKFEEAWRDNVGGSRAVVLYWTEIVALISDNIKSPRWAVKDACRLALADLVSSWEGPYPVLQAHSIWGLLEIALAGKAWEGKEKVIAAYPRFVKAASCLWTEKSTMMKVIALREARRTNVTYRPYAVEALGEVARVREDLNLATDTVELVKDLVDELAMDKQDAMQIDSGNTSAMPAR